MYLNKKSPDQFTNDDLINLSYAQNKRKENSRKFSSVSPERFFHDAEPAINRTVRDAVGEVQRALASSRSQEDFEREVDDIREALNAELRGDTPSYEKY